jgi:hypothetical protein
VDNSVEKGDGSFRATITESTSTLSEHNRLWLGEGIILPIAEEVLDRTARDQQPLSSYPYILGVIHRFRPSYPQAVFYL